MTSLYPFVQKTCRYPIGAPEIITEINDCDIQKFIGLIHCIVLPPKKLRFPILPARIDGKLLFVLCNECGMKKQKEECMHSDKIRYLEGTWVTEEVKLALKYGYKIIKIYSVWHWNQTEMYDETTKSGGLFTGYVNAFLKVKQENSGYPDWCLTDNDKEKYVNDYEENEGIKLDPSKIQFNEGLRSISKLLLNSMWGRYCLQTNKVKYAMISTLKELYSYLLNDRYIVQTIHFLNESKAQVFFSEKEELHQGGKDSNVVLGAFVTCYGRMVLYEELYKLDNRILYYDTDSIIFLSKDEACYEPQLGDYLGKFTSEVKIKDGNHIIEYVLAGPKNYAYKLDSGKTFCKIKGFSVNYIASKSLNFDSMKDLVLSKNSERRIPVEQNIFIKSKEEWTIGSENVQKIYRQVYDKRILNENFETLPFGY